VHLATGFQNILSIVWTSLKTSRIHPQGLAEKYADERKTGETDEQFYYKTRKKGFGDFRRSSGTSGKNAG